MSYYFAEETFTMEVANLCGAVGEKQISVDPISLSPRLMEVNSLRNLPPLAKSKLLSFSLPNSASSSPTKQQQKKKKSCNKPNLHPLARQHSVALSNLERLRESHIQRSKSCGEGRASQPTASVDFDLWSTTSKHENRPESCRADDDDNTIVDVGGGEEEEEAKVMHKINKGQQAVEGESSYEDKFKCGALCLFIPSFGAGKAKTVRARSSKEMEPPQNRVHDMVVSQRVSLEKFECGSWRSSAVINYEEQFGDGSTSSNLFFDLPVEMIRCSTVNDTESPVTTAFVFDNNKDHQHPKGVLKNATTTNTTTNNAARKSHDESSSSSNSSRHVRFSTSSTTLCPTSPSSASSCITPRLLKARDEFNAFLEAQSA